MIKHGYELSIRDKDHNGNDATLFITFNVEEELPGFVLSWSVDDDTYEFPADELWIFFTNIGLSSSLLPKILLVGYDVVIFMDDNKGTKYIRVGLQDYMTMIYKMSAKYEYSKGYYDGIEHMKEVYHYE